MKKPNVSIIVLDTLKLDLFEKIAKNNLNLLSRFDAVRFNGCIAPASWTLPSHASLFTGLYPSGHGSHETKKIKSLDIEHIKLKRKTIVHDLKGMGYSTYGISANPYIHPVYGFTGFDIFEEESYFTDIFGSIIEISGSLKPRISKYRNIYGNDVMKLSNAIMKEDPKLFIDLVASATTLTPRAAVKKMKAKIIDGWPIEKGGKSILRKISEMGMKEPFFLFVNFMEAHDPYIGKKGKDFNWATPFLKGEVDNGTINRWKALYSKASARALRYGTELMGNLLERFGENQIIILTSDHGQAFNEHGFIGHGTVLFDEVVRVPLLVIIPKRLRKKSGSIGKYQSLVNVRKFILSSIRGDADALSRLSCKTAYSETFSIPANISNVKDLDRRKIARFDRYQKRAFT
ncbi:MAG: sulfatase-like hydrolase/transferase [Candidatus Micrarchaeota archaeon]|nr:sulfatase-like hydrolase/transferase [Candidatus Micrarchaeota archaeon]